MNDEFKDFFIRSLTPLFIKNFAEDCDREEITDFDEAVNEILADEYESLKQQSHTINHIFRLYSSGTVQ